MVDLSDDELLAELGVEVETPKARTYTPRQERIIAGFEDIVRFYEERGRAPLLGEDRDIFERLYAVRLDRLRELEECRELLTDMDKHDWPFAITLPSALLLPPITTPAEFWT